MIMKILVVVKTYPNPSAGYQETVCTAGIDEGFNWIRLYPIRFRSRKKEEQYKKYDWIEVDVIKSTKDFRPESYHLTDLYNEIRIINSIGTEDKWRERKRYVLHHLYDSMDLLIKDAYDPQKYVSLATFKPVEIISAYHKPAPNRDWTEKEKAKMAQQDIFENNEKKMLRKVPYDFCYEFKESQGVKSKMRVLDWGIHQLYWNCFDDSNDEKIAVDKVLEKMNDLAKKDFHLILGTTLQYHRRKATNPFTIVGLFYPPKDEQQNIFDVL